MPIKFLFLFMLIIGQANATTTPFMIVSDVDDTIKITGVGDHLRSFGRGVFHTDTFAGMGMLYSYSKNNAVEVGLPPIHPTIYISGSPQFLASKIESMLVQEGFPGPSELYLKKPFPRQSTFDYKLNVLLEVNKKYAEPFILIGDNTQVDTEVYLEFKKRFPRKVLAIYIHEFDEKPIPSSVQSFITAYDIALHEVAAQRLKHVEAHSVGMHVLEKLKDKPRHVIPRFGVCKTREVTSIADNGLVELDRNLQEEIARRCRDILD